MTHPPLRLLSSASSFCCCATCSLLGWKCRPAPVGVGGECRRLDTPILAAEPPSPPSPSPLSLRREGDAAARPPPKEPLLSEQTRISSTRDAAAATEEFRLSGAALVPSRCRKECVPSKDRQLEDTPGFRRVSVRRSTEERETARQRSPAPTELVESSDVITRRSEEAETQQEDSAFGDDGELASAAIAIVGIVASSSSCSEETEAAMLFRPQLEKPVDSMVRLEKKALGCGEEVLAGLQLPSNENCREEDDPSTQKMRRWPKGPPLLLPPPSQLRLLSADPGRSKGNAD